MLVTEHLLDCVLRIGPLPAFLSQLVKIFEACVPNVRLTTEPFRPISSRLPELDLTANVSDGISVAGVDKVKHRVI